MKLNVHARNENIDFVIYSWNNYLKKSSSKQQIPWFTDVNVKNTYIWWAFGNLDDVFIRIIKEKYSATSMSNNSAVHFY